MVLTIGSPSEPKRIAQNVVANTNGPVWSPNGRYLIFSVNDDQNFDPLGYTAIRQPGQFTSFNLPTVGHTDVDITSSQTNQWTVAFIAQGVKGGLSSDFKRLYVADVQIDD